MKFLDIEKIKKQNYGDFDILCEILSQLKEQEQEMENGTELIDFCELVISMNGIEVSLQDNSYGLDLKTTCNIQDNYIIMKGRLADMLTEEFGIQNIWAICYE